VDDTGGFIHLTPSVQRVLTTSNTTVAIHATLTDARVFGLRFYFDSARLQLTSVAPGADTTLHIPGYQLTGDTLNLDGFFHPNFSGNTTIATLNLHVLPVAHDDTAHIGLFFGQGYSGTGDAPQPIDFTGDTATIFIEATPPLPPTHLVIRPIDGDSVKMIWRPVRFDLDGDAVINPRYVIYLTDVINAPNDTDSIGTTFDTTFFDDFIKYTFNADSAAPYDSIIVNNAIYQVRARKTQP
jgi:hypothetical protein